MTFEARLHSSLRRTALIVASLLLLFSQMGPTVLAQDTIPPRLQIGINLFPAIIAANKSVINSDPDAELPIYLVYNANRHLAEQLQLRLAQRGTISERGLEIFVVQLVELMSRELPVSSSIFIVEAPDSQLEQLVSYSSGQQALLFSPYQGDVEHGVNAGFQVTDKVLPLVNMSSLKESKIQLKAFFLRIAVKHE